MSLRQAMELVGAADHWTAAARLGIWTSTQTKFPDIAAVVEPIGFQQDGPLKWLCEPVGKPASSPAELIASGRGQDDASLVTAAGMACSERARGKVA